MLPVENKVANYIVVVRVLETSELSLVVVDGKGNFLPTSRLPVFDREKWQDCVRYLPQLCSPSLKRIEFF